MIADPISQQIMLMDSVLELRWMLSFPSFGVRVPCSRMVVPRTTG